MAHKILLIDDSALSRKTVRDILAQIEEVGICCEAENGEMGLQKIRSEKPDLVIMDVNMPILDGLSTLHEMRKQNLNAPVIMLSVLTQEGAKITIQALEAGAIDFVPKPTPENNITLEDTKKILTQKVRGVLQHKEGFTSPLKQPGIPKSKIDAFASYKAMIIGSSTGGPKALHEILVHLDGDFPLPLVIIQHMPQLFTNAFAKRLDEVSKLTVSEAEDGDLLKSGVVYVAPGDKHLIFEKTPKGNVVRLHSGEKINNHRPSIDVTLESALTDLNGDVCALIMTGMGFDGANGMKKLRDAGGLTLAQDGESSTIFGMNRRAIEIGGIDQIVELKEIATLLKGFYKK